MTNTLTTRPAHGICVECGIRTLASALDEQGFCIHCLDKCTLLDDHHDGLHADQSDPANWGHQGCPLCQQERAEREQRGVDEVARRHIDLSVITSAVYAHYCAECGHVALSFTTWGDDPRPVRCPSEYLGRDGAYHFCGAEYTNCEKVGTRIDIRR